jgi:hypothetical protein
LLQNNKTIISTKANSLTVVSPIALTLSDEEREKEKPWFWEWGFKASPPKRKGFPEALCGQLDG